LTNIVGSAQIEFSTGTLPQTPHRKKSSVIFKLDRIFEQRKLKSSFVQDSLYVMKIRNGTAEYDMD